jgi:hypothetical protein
VRKFTITAIAVMALAITGVAGAALVPGVYDPGNTGCPTATYANGTLHLAKNCATTTNAAAGADITGATGPFTSASFTLASTTQCQGGSPRFDIVTTTGTFFLGCNNVTPVLNADGSATYTFTAATIAAGGNQVPVPTGTITAADVLIDVQGTADLRDITLNGVKQVPVVNGDKNKCKKGGWKTFDSPHFKNQGQCIKYMNHVKHQAKHAIKHHEHDSNDN